MSDVAVTTEDVRGATVLAMEGFWHPNAGADFDRWLDGVKSEVIDWIEAELAMEDGNFRDVDEVLAGARARFVPARSNAVPKEDQ